VSSEGWDSSHPLDQKCTFCNAYFRTYEEKVKHTGEAHADH